MISAIEFAPGKFPTHFDWHIDLDDFGDINNIVLGLPELTELACRPRCRRFDS
jgi:hypothetical protein